MCVCEGGGEKLSCRKERAAPETETNTTLKLPTSHFPHSGPAGCSQAGQTEINLEGQLLYINNVFY